jgi:hypothetical protein
LVVDKDNNTINIIKIWHIFTVIFLSVNK